jgi:hypothetical protein
MPSLLNLMRSEETHHRTMFSVVQTDEQVKAVVEAAQSVIGDLNQPHTGLLFVIELYQVHGLAKPEDNH